MTAPLPHHTPTPQRWHVAGPTLYTYYFRHWGTTFQKTYPPPPLFLATGFPAPNTARPPVDGTLTCKIPMIIFCSWLPPRSRGGASSQSVPPFSLLYPQPTPIQPTHAVERSDKAEGSQPQALRESSRSSSCQGQRVQRQSPRAHTRIYNCPPQS